MIKQKCDKSNKQFNFINCNKYKNESKEKLKFLFNELNKKCSKEKLTQNVLFEKCKNYNKLYKERLNYYSNEIKQKCNKSKKEFNIDICKK